MWHWRDEAKLTLDGLSRRDNALASGDLIGGEEP